MEQHVRGKGLSKTGHRILIYILQLVSGAAINEMTKHGERVQVPLGGGDLWEVGGVCRDIAQEVGRSIGQAQRGGRVREDHTPLPERSWPSSW